MSLTLGTNAVSEDLESLVHLSGIYMLGMDTEYYFFCLSMQLSVYLSIYPSVHPSIYPSIFIIIYLSRVLYHNCNFQPLGARLPRATLSAL